MLTFQLKYNVWVYKKKNSELAQLMPLTIQNMYP